MSNCVVVTFPLVSWVSNDILMEGLNKFYRANLALNSDVDPDTFGKVTEHNKHDSQEISLFPAGDHKATSNSIDLKMVKSWGRH